MKLETLELIQTIFMILVGISLMFLGRYIYNRELYIEALEKHYNECFRLTKIIKI
jgi:hypothetical protein